MSKYEATSEGLFEDGKKIVPEFGNIEQIKALRKYEKRAESMNGEGLDVDDIEWEVTASFTCLCGGRISESKQDIGDMDLSDFDQSKIECRRCNKEYQFFTDEFDELKVVAVKS